MRARRSARVSTSWSDTCHGTSSRTSSRHTCHSKTLIRGAVRGLEAHLCITSLSSAQQRILTPHTRQAFASFLFLYRVTHFLSPSPSLSSFLFSFGDGIEKPRVLEQQGYCGPERCVFCQAARNESEARMRESAGRERHEK